VAIPDSRDHRVCTGFLRQHPQSAPGRPFFSDDLLFATQASTLIAYVAMATAIFVLSRIWRVPLGASIASLSSFIVFPPLSYIFGFSTLLSIVPDAAMGAGVMIIAAGISYFVNDRQ
jgi:hypothetical protein